MKAFRRAMNRMRSIFKFENEACYLFPHIMTVVGDYKDPNEIKVGRLYKMLPSSESIIMKVVQIESNGDIIVSMILSNNPNLTVGDRHRLSIKLNMGKYEITSFRLAS